jgi:hypothetical protein
MSAEQRRCNSVLGGREALNHACSLERGHDGRCSWWEWHQEQVARHEYARRWRYCLNPPAFRLEDYRDFLTNRLAQRRAAMPTPTREDGCER